MTLYGNDSCCKYFIIDSVLFVGDNTTTRRNAVVNPSAVPSTIVIPDYFDSFPVKCIGQYAFTNLVGVTNIVLGKNVVSIYKYALGDLPNLRTINIPSSVQFLGPSSISFYNNSNNSAGRSLTQVLFEPKSSLEVISQSVFLNSINVQIFIPDKINNAKCATKFDSSIEIISPVKQYLCGKETRFNISMYESDIKNIISNVIFFLSITLSS